MYIEDNRGEKLANAVPMGMGRRIDRCDQNCRKMEVLCQCLKPRLKGVSRRNDQMIEMNDTG